MSLLDAILSALSLAVVSCRSNLSRNETHCGLLLRLTKVLHKTGKLVVLDSGFCVLKALVELKKQGVFASAVIKKRRYWPKYCAGGAIQYYVEYMAKMPVGGVTALSGDLEEVPYHIMVMCDVDWVMKLFTTYGTTFPQTDSEQKYRRLENNSVTFQYTEPFANHYRFRHAVDDHNNLRHSDVSIEETWRTQRWENRVFAFLLAVSEINAFLAFRFFVWKDTERHDTTLEFRRRLAKEMIFNEDILKEEAANDLASPVRVSKRKSQHVEHEIQKAPHHCKRFNGSKWVLGAKQKYQQHACRGGSSKTRTYCLCSIGEWMCGNCHTKHIADVVSEQFSSKEET